MAYPHTFYFCLRYFDLRYAGLGAKALLTDALSAPFYASATLDKIIELTVRSPVYLLLQ